MNENNSGIIGVQELDPSLEQQLERVPRHVAEELGELSLELSHVDMFVAVERTSSGGSTYLEADFETAITDPDFDEESLEADAIEAAHAGQEHVSKLITRSASLLSEAHEMLEQEGITFADPDIETDAQRDQRETHERDIIYSKAYELAIEKAVSAQASGEQDTAVSTLEALIILRSIREKNNLDPSRRVFRDVVRNGLQDELLRACQDSRQIYVGTEGRTISGSLWGVNKLLSYASGKYVDEDFSKQDRAVTIDSSLQKEDIADLLAVLSMADSPIFVQDINARGLVVLGKIHKVSELPSDQQHDQLELMYKLIEEVELTEDFSNLISNCDDPLAIVGEMNRYGLKAWQIQDLFARRGSREGSYETFFQVDKGIIDQFHQLEEVYPEYCKQILEELSSNHNLRNRETGGIAIEPKILIELIPVLEKNDLMTKEMLALALAGENSQHIMELSSYIHNLSEEYSLTPQDVPKKLAQGGVSLVQLLRLAESGGKEGEFSQEFQALVLDGLTQAEIKQFFVERYTSAENPTKKLSEIGIENFPMLHQRLQSLELSEELIGEMFASWRTYTALGKHYYNKGDDSERLNEQDIKKISADQMNAFMSQIKSLEDCVDKLGLEKTNQIINIFGIYNFSRHKPDALGDQLDRWLAGDPVKNVVVDARADWNSFTGSKVQFGEGVGQGVFFFEANSGRDAARIAITVGRHERQAGREPDVERFVVHAHGSPAGMIMGVNDEKISTDTYLAAARRSSKISTIETNDYKRHLGQNFNVILQSCSTGKELEGMPNIAQIISQTHDTTVQSSDVIIYGLAINEDGSVKFSVSDTSNEGNNEPVVYVGGAKQT